MKNKTILNLIKNKYLYVSTLFAVGLLAQISEVPLVFEPNQSLHLSSNVTEDESSIGAADQYYDLQLRLLENHPVTIESTNNDVVLLKDSVVSVRVPLRALNGVTEISKVNLSNLIFNLPKLDDPPNNLRNEVEILDTDKTQELYVGESAKINLKPLVDSKKLKLERIEESKEQDEDVVENTVESSNEGSVECATGECKNSSSILNAMNNIFDKPKEMVNSALKSIEDVVSSFVNSDFNKNLQAKIKSGFKMRLGKFWNTGREIKLKDGAESMSYKKCLRGVKMALMSSGVVDKYLGEEKAKNFGSILKKEGFINLLDTDYKSKIKNPCDTPVGSVSIYSGGKAGHAEIRTENGFMSDHFNNDARIGCTSGMAGRGRRLIGVYIKKTTEASVYLANNKGSKK